MKKKSIYQDETNVLFLLRTALFIAILEYKKTQHRFSHATKALQQSHTERRRRFEIARRYCLERDLDDPESHRELDRLNALTVDLDETILHWEHVLVDSETGLSQVVLGLLQLTRLFQTDSSACTLT